LLHCMLVYTPHPACSYANPNHNTNPNLNPNPNPNPTADAN